MIIFRGDAEFGVEIVKFALRRTKITLSRRGMCPDARKPTPWGSPESSLASVMIIFRGDAEFGVEIFKFESSRAKITFNRRGMCPDARTPRRETLWSRRRLLS